VFPAAGLVVGFCPRKPEHVGKETFGEAVATHNGFGKRVTIGKEANDTAIDFDEARTFHATDHLRNRGTREFKSIGYARLDDVNVVLA
jgi:hypothetical protein